MYDIKNNWFYKMCTKQCTKDFGLIFVGFLLAMAGVLLFTAVISVLNILLILIGLFLLVSGVRAFLFKLPKLREQMQRMPADDLKSLGSMPPQCMYGTFYFTPKYLCIPAAYALIRYKDIRLITPNVVSSNGRETSIFVNIEFTNGQPSIDVTVKNWGTFKREVENFMAMIEQHKNNLEV